MLKLITAVRVEIGVLTFEVYKHATPPRFVNVTAIQYLESELPIVISLVETLYKVNWNHVKVNMVFASRNYSNQKLSYCLSSMIKLGQALYGGLKFNSPQAG